MDPVEQGVVKLLKPRRIRSKIDPKQTFSYQDVQVLAHRSLVPTFSLPNRTFYSTPAQRNKSSRKVSTTTNTSKHPTFNSFSKINLALLNRSASGLESSGQLRLVMETTIHVRCMGEWRIRGFFKTIKWTIRFSKENV